MLEAQELAPAVYQYEFPEIIAKSMVSLLDQLHAETWERSPIGTDGNITEYRTSSSFNLVDKFPIWEEEVRKYFHPAINDYCERMSVSVSQDEGFQLLRYQPGNEYKFHSDGEWAMYRNVSALIYLNPAEYGGGETYFKNQDLNVKPEKPSIVVFPSDYAYRHAAMPVTSGEKYVLVTWMNDMPRGFNSEILFHIAKLTGKI